MAEKTWAGNPQVDYLQGNFHEEKHSISMAWSCKYKIKLLLAHQVGGKHLEYDFFV